MRVRSTAVLQGLSQFSYIQRNLSAECLLQACYAKQFARTDFSGSPGAPKIELKPRVIFKSPEKAAPAVPYCERVKLGAAAIPSGLVGTADVSGDQCRRCGKTAYAAEAVSR